MEQCKKDRHKMSERGRERERNRQTDDEGCSYTKTLALNRYSGIASAEAQCHCNVGRLRLNPGASLCLGD